MPKHIGYSVEFDARKIRSLFDIDPDHPDLVSKFEQEFGCSYLDAESFEVYGRDEYQKYNFDAEFISRLLPFSVPDDILSKIDFSSAVAVFFVSTDSMKKNEGLGLTFIGSI
jgi:hypothetical protein